MAEVAVQCLCELATSLGHFNFHGDIFKLLVQWMPLSGGVLGEKVSPRVIIERFFFVLHKYLEI